MRPSAEGPVLQESLTDKKMNLAEETPSPKFGCTEEARPKTITCLIPLDKSPLEEVFVISVNRQEEQTPVLIPAQTERNQKEA